MQRYSEKLQDNGKMRDDATIQQLLVLANMESYNAVLIEQGKEQAERLILLHNLAVKQLQTMEALSVKELPKLPVDKPGK